MKRIFGIITIIAFFAFLYGVYSMRGEFVIASSYTLSGIGLYSSFKIEGRIWNKLKVLAGVGSAILLLFALYWTFEILTL